MSEKSVCIIRQLKWAANSEEAYQSAKKYLDTNDFMCPTEGCAVFCSYPGAKKSKTRIFHGECSEGRVHPDDSKLKPSIDYVYNPIVAQPKRAELGLPTTLETLSGIPEKVLVITSDVLGGLGSTALNKILRRPQDYSPD